MNRFAVHLFLRLAAVESPDPSVEIKAGPETEQHNYTDRQLDSLEVQSLIYYRGQYNCGVTTYTVTLTPLGQHVVDRLRKQAADLLRN